MWRAMIDREGDLLMVKQCELLQVARSTFYYQPAPGHKIYPDLLRGMTIDRPGQVWCTDVASLPMASGFLYPVAIMYLYSREVLSWRVSNTIDTSFCIDTLTETLEKYGAPELFNTDRGSTFTASAVTQVLSDPGVAVSMDALGSPVTRLFADDRQQPAVR